MDAASIDVESRGRLIPFLERDGPRYSGQAGNLESLALLEDTNSGGKRIRRYRSVSPVASRSSGPSDCPQRGRLCPSILGRSNRQLEHSALRPSEESVGPLIRANGAAKVGSCTRRPRSGGSGVGFAPVPGQIKFRESLPPWTGSLAQRGIWRRLPRAGGLLVSIPCRSV